MNDHFEHLLARKDQQIAELEEKNDTLLGTIFKKEQENAELKRKLEDLQRAFLRSEDHIERQ